VQPRSSRSFIGIVIAPRALTRMGAMNDKVVGIDVHKKVVNSKAPGYREKVIEQLVGASGFEPPTARMYPFVGERLVKAISATFRNRGTTIEAEPIGLTQAYCDDPARAIQWRAFVRRSRFGEEAGERVRLVTEIRQFALPVLSAVAGGNRSNGVDGSRPRSFPTSTLSIQFLPGRPH